MDRDWQDFERRLAADPTNPALLEQARQRFIRSGRSIDAQLAVLRGRDGLDAYRAALAELAPLSLAAVPLLLGLLREPRGGPEGVSVPAASLITQTLAGFGARAWPLLRDALEDRDEGGWGDILDILKASEEAGATALAELAGDARPRLATFALLAIRDMRCPPPQRWTAAEAVCAACGAEDRQLRRAASEALERLMLPAERAVPVFQRLLNDAIYGTRYVALRALGRYGAEAEPALADIEWLVREDDSNANRELAARLSKSIRMARRGA